MAYENVIFDSIVVISDSVSYNSASGTITLLQPDRYEFDWWVDRQSSASSNGVGFALVSSQGDVLVGKIKPSVISKALALYFENQKKEVAS